MGVAVSHENEEDFWHAPNHSLRPMLSVSLSVQAVFGSKSLMLQLEQKAGGDLMSEIEEGEGEDKKT
jgi:hypothetical protein